MSTIAFCLFQTTQAVYSLDIGNIMFFSFFILSLIIFSCSRPSSTVRTKSTYHRGLSRINYWGLPFASSFVRST
jgi:hypothetical protein